MDKDNFKDLVVVKRSGQRVSFNGTKIAVAIKASFDSIQSNYTELDVNKVYNDVLNYIANIYSDRKTINVEQIQDIIEEKLKDGYNDVYEAFSFYRLRRAASREVFSEKQQHKFVKTIEKLGLQSNLNLNSTPIDIMHDFGKTVSEEFAKAYLLENKYVRLHDEGIIYIHDLSCYPLCTTQMSHLNFTTLSSSSISAYCDDIYKIIYSIKKEETSEQSIHLLNSLLLPISIDNLKNIFKRNIVNYLNLNGLTEYMNIKQIFNLLNDISFIDFDISIFDNYIFNDVVKDIFTRALNDARIELSNVLHDSIKKMLIDLNNMDISINNNKVLISCNNLYDPITKIYIDVLNELDTLNNVCSVFKLKDSEEANDLLIQIILDSKNVCISYDSEDFLERFSSGEKIFKNVNDQDMSSLGRIILSTTSINLSRIAIINKDNQLEDFYKNLSDILDLVKNQLMQRFELQSNKYKKNFPNLFKYNLLMDSEKLDEYQKIRKVLRNGAFCIGIVGLNECVEILNKKNIKLDILNFINNRLNQYSMDNRVNFIMSQTNNKKILKDLLAIDKSIYGLDLFDKNKNRYSIITIEDSVTDFLYPEVKEIQNVLNMRVDIYLRKNSSGKRILEVIQKAYKNDIKFFKIKFGKNAD